MSGATLERRLANFRRATRPEPRDPRLAESRELAERMAAALDGELLEDELGRVVRCEPMTAVVPIDRDRLAALPGQPPPDVPLVCLDTETTGLATATGTVAWLIGLGWWEGERFRQAQLLLPDHADEPALLARLAAHVPRTAWLVTYNGRGFDWPLLTTRYRMHRGGPPPHAGHLDLLPFVRRVFRHRLADARLRTVESALLGVARHEDVDGWEIPSRYLAFLHGGPAEPLADVVRHNREDVRSLGRLLADIDVRFGAKLERPDSHPGDLAGLARAYARERRLAEALELLDVALVNAAGDRATVSEARIASTADPADEDWWLPRRRADVGGPPRVSRGWPTVLTDRLESPWTEERISVERARMLRRLGRFSDAVEAWRGIASGSGAPAVHALVEIAKLREHRLGDPSGALAAARRARHLADRRRAMGLGDPAVSRAIDVRVERLSRRVAGRPTAVARTA
jgi:uncharacterized protein YprB with RNaseH-like and TPR domain